MELVTPAFMALHFFMVTHRRNQQSPSPYLHPQIPERGHRKRGIFLSSITVVATTWKEERGRERTQKRAARSREPWRPQTERTQSNQWEKDPGAQWR